MILFSVMNETGMMSAHIEECEVIAHTDLMDKYTSPSMFDVDFFPVTNEDQEYELQKKINDGEQLLALIKLYLEKSDIVEKALNDCDAGMRLIEELQNAKNFLINDWQKPIEDILYNINSIFND